MTAHSHPRAGVAAAFAVGAQPDSHAVDPQTVRAGGRCAWYNPFVEIRDLTQAEVGSAEFWHLLWLSVEVDDESLRRIRDDLLPYLSVIGVVADGVVIGFAAYDGESRVTVEYIATAESRRGTGIATALIGEVRRRNPSESIHAQTDDDAIGFYRKAGFVDVPVPRDPRWPERQRYRCVLAPSG